MAAHPLSRQKCKARVGQRFTAGGVQYKLMGSLGDGAVGLVRKAQSINTERIVAVKFLAPGPKYIEPSRFDDVAERFKREGKRGAGLDHANLVKILAYEENSDGEAFAKGHVKNPFLVMEYVRGGTLEHLIRKYEASPIAGAEITVPSLTIAAAIARALQYLHTHKITHRDVKPANVFLSTTDVRSVPATIKLGDFGVTKWGDFLAAASSGTLTVTSQQGLGTLKYMSPEQAVRPRDVTVRSDIFPLGITLWELFTGQILPSPHHVFEIMGTRAGRGNVWSKLMSLGITATPGESEVFELVLDMFLRGAKGRPTAARIAAIMEFYAERLAENEV